MTAELELTVLQEGDEELGYVAGFAITDRMILVAGGTSQQLDEIAFDDDGRVVAAGYVNNGGGLIATTRYSADGIIDASFGESGVSTAPAAGLGPRMLVQADGRIVVLGANSRGAGGADLALWRFWP